MFAPISDLLQYLNIHNGHRIAGLFVNDPFAIFGFILLVLMVPTALVLLMVTARRSVHSIFDGIRHEARYRQLRRAARTTLLSTSQLRTPHRSNRATAGTKRVSFLPIPSPPLSSRTRKAPRPSGAPRPQKRASILGSRLAPKVTTRVSLTGSTFEDVYDRWSRAHRAPKLDVELEDTDAGQTWATDFQADLRVSAFRAGLRE